MKRFLKILQKINLKTIFFNFKYLPIKQAIKLPILISRKVYLREISGKILIKGPIRPGLIQLGYGNIGIFDNKKSRSIWEVSGTVIFKGRANIGHGSKISVGKNGELILGENFIITAESSLVASKKIEFGNNCLLSWDILIMDTDSHIIKDNTGSIINYPKQITIGDNVWIGCRCLILKGAQIPDNCVIGADSIVNRLLENRNSLYAGSPVKLMKESITWEM